MAELLASPYRDRMFSLIEALLRDIGPRESCSESERRLGRALAARWQDLGFEVRTEPFTCHPRAFLGFLPVVTLLYLAAVALYWVWPFATFLLAAVAFAALWFELLRYRELVDPLFPAARGENVVGVIRPAQPVERRVVVSAHQDSAYEFNLWYFLGNAAVPVMVLAFVAPLVPLLGGLAKSFAGAGSDSSLFDVVGYVGLGLYPIVGLNLFFHTYSVVPGAMDDLAGISVLDGVAQALAEAGPLERTEVVLLAASSEEAGLRGAKRYAEAHAAEMRALPTWGIFVDGVYDERHLTVVRRELFTGAQHDPGLVGMAKEIAAARGWRIREHMIPLGATDATAFSLAGVPSVALLCQDATRLVPNYHTRLDTLEHVRPESLEVMLQMVLDLLSRLDAGRRS